MIQWKPVINYEGIYQVSNQGDVMRITDSPVHKGGNILKPDETHNGYLRVSISMNKRPKKFFVHRLVYTSFVGEIPPKMEINHKDGNKKNNNVDNLEIVTSKENKRHAFFTLHVGCEGEKHGMAKLKNKDIPIIRQLIKDGMSIANIGSQFGVSKDTISLIKNNKIWKSVK